MERESSANPSCANFSPAPAAAKMFSLPLPLPMSLPAPVSLPPAGDWKLFLEIIQWWRQRLYICSCSRVCMYMIRFTTGSTFQTYKSRDTGSLLGRRRGAMYTTRVAWARCRVQTARTPCTLPNVSNSVALLWTVCCGFASICNVWCCCSLAPGISSHIETFFLKPVWHFSKIWFLPGNRIIWKSKIWNVEWLYVCWDETTSEKLGDLIAVVKSCQCIVIGYSEQRADTQTTNNALWRTPDAKHICWSSYMTSWQRGLAVCIYICRDLCGDYEAGGKSFCGSPDNLDPLSTFFRMTSRRGGSSSSSQQRQGAR